jgi:hypothetical protein
VEAIPKVGREVYVERTLLSAAFDFVGGGTNGKGTTLVVPYKYDPLSPA